MPLRSLLFALFSVLGACSSAPPLDREITAAPPAGLTLVYSHALRGESRPCGCPQAPMGGLNRQWNLLSVWRKEANDKNIISLAGGGLYTTSRKFAQKRPESAMTVAQLVAESQKLLKVDYVAPTIDDLALGLKRLKTIETLSGATWVSANLANAKGALLYKPYVEVVLEGLPYPVLITGISHSLKGKSEAKVLPPAKALSSVLAKLEAKPRLLVVISSLSRKENERLVQAVPSVHVLLGGEGDNAHFAQLSPTTIYSEPVSEGKELLRLKLTPRDAALTFFNPDTHYQLWKSRESKLTEISLLEDRIEAQKSPAAKKKLQKEKANYEQQVAELSKLLTGDRSKTGLLYEQDRQLLSVGYETPENPVSKLLSEAMYQSAASAPTTK